jgi:adenylate cyclase
VVGKKKFAFDIWGETVNFASRMESSGAPNRINMSETTHARVKDFFLCEHRGKIKTKDGNEADMYFANCLVPTIAAITLATIPPPGFTRRYKAYFRKEPPAFPECLGRQACDLSLLESSGNPGSSSCT